MSAQLAQMMGKSHGELSYVLEKLESLSGHQSLDNHLLSEIRAKLWPKISELGLDPTDTTSRELYHAVLARFTADNDLFANLLGSAAIDSDAVNNRISHLLEVSGVMADSWVLKRKTAKNLVEAHKPAKLQKYLNYRSLTSMCKREDIAEIFAALPLVESAAWLSKFNKDLAKLKPSDFEIRPISINVMKADRWSIIRPEKSVTSLNILGSAVLWPRRSKGSDLSVFINLIRTIEEISLKNLALMDCQVKADFASCLSDYLNNKPVNKTSEFGINLHNLAHFYSRLPADFNPFAGEPHMQNIRMLKFSPAKIIAAIHPVLRWWEGNDYLGVNSEKGVVSLNLSDAANNFVRSREYLDKSYKFLKHDLWNELLGRYMSYPAVENRLLNKYANTEYAFERPTESVNNYNYQRKTLQLA